VLIGLEDGETSAHAQISEGMRPAGLIPSFQPDRVALPGSGRPAKGREVPEPLSRSCSAFGSLRSRTRRPSMRAYHRPRGLQPPLASFKTPGCVPRRDAPSAPPRSSALSTRITRGLIHPLVSPALPLGRTCARVSRALLVTLGS
jgi:hypothetical protein